MRESALVTGITGQDGSYLAEFLLSKGYEVHGVVRRTSTENLERIEHLEGKIQLHEADLLDAGSLLRAIRGDIFLASSIGGSVFLLPSSTGIFFSFGFSFF